MFWLRNKIFIFWGTIPLKTKGLRYSSLCLLGILHACSSSADFFSKSTFSKNTFMNTIRVSNSLDPDQVRHFVGPDLDPNCLQRLSADGTSTN